MLVCSCPSNQYPEPSNSILVPNIIYYWPSTFVFLLLSSPKEMSIEKCVSFCTSNRPSVCPVFYPATDMFNVIDRLWFIYRIKFIPSFIRSKENKRQISSEPKKRQITHWIEGSKSNASTNLMWSIGDNLY